MRNRNERTRGYCHGRNRQYESVAANGGSIRGLFNNRFAAGFRKKAILMTNPTPSEARPIKNMMALKAELDSLYEHATTSPDINATSLSDYRDNISATIDHLIQRETDLLAANNQYLERARKAEAERDELRAFAAKISAKRYGDVVGNLRDEAAALRQSTGGGDE